MFNLIIDFLVEFMNRKIVCNGWRSHPPVIKEETSISINCKHLPFPLFLVDLLLSCDQLTLSLGLANLKWNDKKI